MVQPLFSSVLKGISGRGVRRIGRKYMNKKFLLLLHPLSNIEITEYFNHEPRFNSVFSRNNLPRIKDRVYVINLDDQKSKGTHWVSLFIDKHLDVYFDSFEIECIPQEQLCKTKDQLITHKIFRIQDNEPIICGFYLIAFIEHMLAGKTLLDYINLFSPNGYKKNGKIMYEYFKDEYVKLNLD